MKISSDDKDVKLKRIAGPFIFLHSTAHLLPLCLRREGTGVRCQKSEVGGRRDGEMAGRNAKMLGCWDNAFAWMKWMTAFGRDAKLFWVAFQPSQSSQGPQR